MTDAHAPAPTTAEAANSPQWWPSRYGAEDELGAGNELTPERAMAALKIPKQGRVIQLAQLLEPGIPAYPPRAWHQLILAHGQLEATLSEPDGAHVSWFEEHVNQTYQIGCHLDGLAHLGIDGRYYNGFHYKDIYSPTGLRRLGIEHAPQWVARGVCLDIAALEGTAMLEEGFAITSSTSRRPASGRASTSAPVTSCCSTPAGRRCGWSTTPATAPSSRGSAGTARTG